MRIKLKDNEPLEIIILNDESNEEITRVFFEHNEAERLLRVVDKMNISLDEFVRVAIENYIDFHLNK